MGEGLAGALTRLEEITRRLRRECPWDREQDERSIVPHTVEEAYELADAAHSGDDAKLLDELGDVLFQVFFLSLLLEERGKGDLAAVADGCREKLIRRHPHVFGDRPAETAGDVVRNWNQIKRDDERGGEIFGELPENLPATLYARKLQKRAESAGHGGKAADEALVEVRRSCERLLSPTPSDSRQTRFEEVGRLLFAAVEAAGALEVDPEVTLRRQAAQFRAQIEEADPR
ncbi:MAG TPA: MazG family protein [Thermoleophilaceae bacterium]|nr:MazG family protein [Thermoleophilaceae bacterium]